MCLPSPKPWILQTTLPTLAIVFDFLLNCPKYITDSGRQRRTNGKADAECITHEELGGYFCRHICLRVFPRICAVAIRSFAVFIRKPQVAND